MNLTWFIKNKGEASKQLLYLSTMYRKTTNYTHLKEMEGLK